MSFRNYLHQVNFFNSIPADNYEGLSWSHLIACSLSLYEQCLVLARQEGIKGPVFCRDHRCSRVIALKRVEHKAEYQFQMR